MHKGICEGSCPEVADHLLLQKADDCTSELGGLDLKFTLEVNVMDAWAARAL